MYNSQKNRKGIWKTDKNNCKNDDKIVRNLSQVSYITQKNTDYTSFINLLKENNSKEHYDKREFPFCNYFYYSDYLNEKYKMKN